MTERVEERGGERSFFSPLILPHRKDFAADTAGHVLLNSNCSLERREVWKCVRRAVGSLVTSEFRPPWKTTYVRNQKTTPAVKGSLLFAFSSLEHAQNSTQHQHGWEIWRALAVDVHIPPSSVPLKETHFKSFWDGEESDQPIGVDEGTVLCGTITLLEKV